MASIDEIILRSSNPFDNTRSINFWEKQAPEPTVDSIHYEAINTIETILDEVSQDHQTRTVILDGDGGSGKTYLLGRLKKTFNDKAFFVYIPPFPESNYIWRHILRYTVSSLVRIPEGQTDSQLLLWLISVLSAIKQPGVKERLLKDDIFNLLRSDRRKFINKLKEIYKQVSIYNADNFFGVLHDLTNSELFPLACEWLRGDDLSEESLQTLRLRSSIATEEAAREIIANFSRIAGDTRPIVLCFDQLESIALLPDGSLDLQTLFNVNTKIRDENSNFLIIISITTNTWEKNKARIDQTHKDRIHKKLELRNITLTQAESLLASRLDFLHRQAHPQPNSPIYPVTRQYLEEGFPSGKTNPREAINFGRDIFQQYKEWLLKGGTINNFQPSIGDIKPPDLQAAFKLKWQEELTKVQQRITKISNLSPQERIQRLQEALAALQIEKIQTALFTGTVCSSYSLDYQLPGKSEQLGVIWTEDKNLKTFFYVMEACRKAIEKNPSLTLQLIRAEILGNSSNKGYQRYVEIFSGLPHHHITPDIASVQYLETYHSLARDAREGDLVIGSKIISLQELQALVRELRVLDDCLLLQDLKVVKINGESSTKKPEHRNIFVNGKTVKVVIKDVIESKEFLFNLMSTQQIMGKKALIENVHSHFPLVNELKIEELIEQLCNENKITILDRKVAPEAQLVCLIPKK